MTFQSNLKIRILRKLPRVTSNGFRVLGKQLRRIELEIKDTRQLAARRIEPSRS
jgi:hypothetical protein